MHNLSLRISDEAYPHLMFFLKKTQVDVEILEHKQSDKKQPEAKITQNLAGILKGKHASIKDYHNYLEDRYS
jgi:hypothetical protein